MTTSFAEGRAEAFKSMICRKHEVYISPACMAQHGRLCEVFIKVAASDGSCWKFFLTEAAFVERVNGLRDKSRFIAILADAEITLQQFATVRKRWSAQEAVQKLRVPDPARSCNNLCQT